MKCLSNPHVIFLQNKYHLTNFHIITHLFLYKHAFLYVLLHLECLCIDNSLNRQTITDNITDTYSTQVPYLTTSTLLLLLLSKWSIYFSFFCMTIMNNSCQHINEECEHIICNSSSKSILERHHLGPNSGWNANKHTFLDIISLSLKSPWIFSVISKIFIFGFLNCYSSKVFVTRSISKIFYTQKINFGLFERQVFKMRFFCFFSEVNFPLLLNGCFWACFFFILFFFILKDRQ